MLADYEESEDRGPRRRYVRRPRKCTFCTDRTKVIDYKDADLLRRYITEHARMRPRRTTGTCARHQRALAKAIKRARHLALLPYSTQHVQLQRG
ncbi:MAG: 30S ribosomal protein S18 [Chloroflexi bacterium]|nr:30S ribosomal protein S18 [Chloroflexota bacterium]